MPGRGRGCRAGRNGGGQPEAAFRQPLQHCGWGSTAMPAPRPQFSVNWTGPRREPPPQLSPACGGGGYWCDGLLSTNPPPQAGEGRVGAAGAGLLLLLLMAERRVLGEVLDLPLDHLALAIEERGDRAAERRVGDPVRAVDRRRQIAA